ncbi:efflux RND transporter periplasmic adaptor subunit [Cohnella terricola]|uniref:Efflux RND transporter periplasmic adaptor subunit n=1 Tax=Cohnella terricola TaxID=1289167 RepID=A0A559JIQ3_9BACL|nr:efflux RND transporter periplasmic adaptor subunit [Cohnella terricola]TVX99749.1 efflux RND transporter periplasmic adaptor subunit [Cohnella terricola]
MSISNSNKRVKRRARTVSIAVVLAAGIAVIAGCSSQPKTEGAAETAANANQVAAKTVKVAEIAKIQIAEPLEQVADVLASAQVHIVAKAGADVQQIMKKRGETVKAGDVIVALDDTDALLQQEQSLLSRESAALSLETGRKQWESNLAKMELALSEATKNYNKMKNDYDAGLVGKSELNQAETAYTTAKSDLALLKETGVAGLEMQLKASQLSVVLSERALANYEIKAPISGVLSELTVQEGMTISPGFAIGEILQIDPIKVKTLLSAQAANAARGKTQLQFYVPGSSSMYTGKVTYFADVVDTQTNAYELNLSIANPDKALKPGMKVQVRLTEAAEEQVVAIPTLSIVREGADSYVFVLNGDKAEKRKVELGRLNELNQEIISGVKAGEKLIVSGQHQLSDGEQVNVAN